MFEEPFIDRDNRKIYEWENDKEVRFRTIVDKIRGEGLQYAPLSPSNEVIITFYSDRNLNKKLEFKNPKVREYYKAHTGKHNSFSDEKENTPTKSKKR